jgi:hypothetical protein
MIEAKYKYSGEEKWNLKEFETEQDMRKFLEEDPKEIEDYKFRPKKTNPIIKYFQNGGKEKVFDTRFPNEKDRNIHSISTFNFSN